MTILKGLRKKSIDPKRDKMPIIIVAVDEASAIFGVRSRNSTKKKWSDRAGELCEDIVKELCETMTEQVNEKVSEKKSQVIKNSAIKDLVA